MLHPCLFTNQIDICEYVGIPLTNKSQEPKPPRFPNQTKFQLDDAEQNKNRRTRS